MNCKQCGSEIKENNKFCNGCGTPVESVEYRVETKEQATTEKTKVKTVKPKSKWKIKLFGLLIVIVLFGGTYVMRNTLLEIGYGKLSDRYKASNFEKAEKWAGKANNLNEDNRLLELLYADKGNSLIEVDPQKAKIYIMKAAEYGEANEYDQSIAKAYMNEARISLEYAPEEALEILTEGMLYDNNKESATLYVDICIAISEKLKVNDIDEAIVYLLKGFEANATEEVKALIVEAYIEKAKMLIESDSLDQAKEILEKAKKYKETPELKALNEDIIQKLAAASVVANNSYMSANSSSYILSHSNYRKLTTSDVVYLNSWELKVARNEIYARHGYVFKTDAFKSYFNKMDWYTPNYNFTELDLDEIEKYNVNFIKSYE